jgi:hypothetical protein
MLIGGRIKVKMDDVMDEIKDMVHKRLKIHSDQLIQLTTEQICEGVLKILQTYGVDEALKDLADK